MDAARPLTEQWWSARAVLRFYPDDGAERQFLAWLRQFALGRKRLLDTLLAPTYYQAGVHSLLAANPADFDVSSAFNCITLKARIP